jgi:hypothetical protein
MKVEVLYFQGCPNHQPTVERVRQVLLEQGIPPEVTEIEVSDDRRVAAVEFVGSPTVRINGVDVEPGVEPIERGRLYCRTYLENGKRVGVPSQDLIRRAVLSTTAQQGREGHL